MMPTQIEVEPIDLSRVNIDPGVKRYVKQNIIPWPNHHSDEPTPKLTSLCCFLPIRYIGESAVEVAVKEGLEGKELTDLLGDIGFMFGEDIDIIPRYAPENQIRTALQEHYS